MTCGHWSDDLGLCDVPTAKLYVTGRRCPAHTPAALAGRPETTPDPDGTLEGLRAAAGLDPLRSYTPASPTVVDDRAVASGKRRSSHHGYRAAQAATDRSTP